jgi:hypothetical protein
METYQTTGRTADKEYIQRYGIDLKKVVTPYCQ